MNLAVRQGLIGAEASVTQRVSDPLNAMRLSMRTERPYTSPDLAAYTLDLKRGLDTKAVYLAFNYSFGKAPRLPSPKPQEEQASGL